MIDGKLLYPIGSIYMSIQDTNPSVFFGGTWERIAKGKTLVGVDENDTDFNASSKTGGEKAHTLTIQEIPSHNHNRIRIVNGNQYLGPSGGSNFNVAGINLNSGAYPYNNENYNNAETSSAGGGQSHNNMQPFYTCYIFVRTA